MLESTYPCLAGHPHATLSHPTCSVPAPRRASSPPASLRPAMPPVFAFQHVLRSMHHTNTQSGVPSTGTRRCCISPLSHPLHACRVLKDSYSLRMHSLSTSPLDAIPPRSPLVPPFLLSPLPQTCIASINHSAFPLPVCVAT